MDNLRAIERQSKALGNKRRLEILRMIKKDGRISVTDLARALHVTVAAASRHLAILERAHILLFIRRDKYVIYRLSLDQQEPARTVLRML